MEIKKTKSNIAAEFEAAVKNGDTDAIEILSMKVDDSSKGRAFEILFKKGDIEKAEFLASLEGIIITEEIKEMGVRIAIEEDNVDILKFLEGQEEASTDVLMIPPVRYVIGAETFIKAVKGGAIKIVEFLINKGVDPNGNYGSKHSLVIAIENVDVKMINLLKSKGAKADFEVLKDAFFDTWFERTLKGEIQPTYRASFIAEILDEAGMKK